MIENDENQTFFFGIDFFLMQLIFNSSFDGGLF
jgi:hypothetical protein